MVASIGHWPPGKLWSFFLPKVRQNYSAGCGKTILVDDVSKRLMMTNILDSQSNIVGWKNCTALYNGGITGGRHLDLQRLGKTIRNWLIDTNSVDSRHLPVFDSGN